MSGLGWTDSHCHLQDDEDVAAVVARARAAGVQRMVCIGTDLAKSRAALALASAHDGVWATVGLHPHDAIHGVEPLASLAEQAVGGPLVAVGECGLDYHYDHSPRQAQRSAFAEQIQLAKRLDLALVIHTREAWDDTFAILESEGVPERTVFHCFTGGPGEARRCLDIGAWLSFSGIVTFPSAPEVREAAALCPAERLMIETDSPFLTPVPHRGRRNEPALVPLVGLAVAAARDEPVEQVAEHTSRAASAAFRLPAPEALA